MIFDQAGRSYATARAHGGPAVLNGGWAVYPGAVFKVSGRMMRVLFIAMVVVGLIGFASMIAFVLR